MTYNFDTTPSRKGTHSIKWDTKNDVLPMWIADMDFETFPPITEALVRMAGQGHYGYNIVPDRFYDAIMLWWKKQHSASIQREWILPSSGVVAGISAVLSALVKPGEEVIIQTPAYNHFFNMIEGCGAKMVANELIYEYGVYRLDLEDLERKAASPNAKVLLLCNPHNPVGRGWTERELHDIAAICAKYEVDVISDEIHSDLIAPGSRHVPFSAITNHHNLPLIISSAASKTFNLSGLHAAYLFVDDAALRKKIESQLWARAAGWPGLMACEATSVAYEQGEEWVTQLNEYIQGNYRFLKDFLEANQLPITVLPLEATYLVWLDCKQLGRTSKELSEQLLEREKLWLNAGDMYGVDGEGFLRMNIACSREILREGVERLGRGIRYQVSGLGG